MIIALLNQKGGVGKTTLALHLAGQWAKQSKRTILIDADPQGSALDWSEQRAREGWPKRIQCSMRFSNQVSSTRVRSFVLYSFRQSAGELAFITHLHHGRGIRARAAFAAFRRRSFRAERQRL